MPCRSPGRQQLINDSYTAAILFDMRPLIPRDPMPLDSTPACKTRKRTLSEVEPIAVPLAPPFTKRRKLKAQRRYRTPAAFWDNLTKQWLTPRALKEFDRRTVRPRPPIPPNPSALKRDHIAELKRFARHGGPSLSDLRAVSRTVTALGYR